MKGADSPGLLGTSFMRVWLFFGIMLLIGWKARYGIDFTDEGFYVSSGYRFFRGDGSDSLATLRQVDLLNAGLFYLYPKIGLYELRLVGGLFQALACTVLFSYLRRRTCLTLALSGALLMALWNIYLGILAPGYNLYASTLLTASTLALADLPVARTSWPTLLKIFLCGAALGVMVIAYGTLLPLALVILCCYAWLFHRSTDNKAPIIVLFAGAASSIIICVALLLYGAGLHEWMGNLKTLSLLYSKTNRLEVAGKLVVGLFKFHRHSVLIALITAASLAGSFLFKRHLRIILFLSINSILLLALSSPENWVSTHENYYAAIFVVASFIPQILSYLLLQRPHNYGDLIPFVIGVLAWIIFSLSTYYFTPARSFAAGFQAFPLLVAGLLPAIAGINSKVLEERPRASRQLKWLGITIGLVYLFLELGLGMQYFAKTIYCDAERSTLTAEFSPPRLRHILSSPDRVKAVAELSRKIAEIADAGDYLLAYDEAPLLYYLLDKKSFTPTVWLSDMNGRDYTFRLLSEAILHNEPPKLAIKCLVDLSAPDWNDAPRTDYSQSFTNAYVTTNYELKDSAFPFEIWQLKAGSNL